jgi:hypothetical protein
MLCRRLLRFLPDFCTAALKGVYPVSHDYRNLYSGGIDVSADRRYSALIHSTLGALANTFRPQTSPGLARACMFLSTLHALNLSKNSRANLPMNCVPESNSLLLPHRAAPEEP